MLKIDWTLLAQIGLFLILWAFLKRLVFDPVLRILDERERRTVGTQAEAEHLVATAQTARDDYEQSLFETRAELARAAERARQAAQDEHAKAVAEARARAAEELNRVRESLRVQVEQARGALVEDASRIASEMLSRAMGRP